MRCPPSSASSAEAGGDEALCREPERCTKDFVIRISVCLWGTHQFRSVQSLSRVRLLATPWIAACQASLSITNSWSSLKLMSIRLLYYRSNTNYCMSSFKHLLIFLISHVHITTSVQFISFLDSSLCWPISILILSNYFPLRSQRDSNNVQNRACHFLA